MAAQELAPLSAVESRVSLPLGLWVALSQMHEASSVLNKIA